MSHWKAEYLSKIKGGRSVQMLRIGEEWKLSEIPKQSRILIEKIGIPIM